MFSVSHIRLDATVAVSIPLTGAINAVDYLTDRYRSV